MSGSRPVRARNTALAASLFGEHVLVASSGSGCYAICQHSYAVGFLEVHDVIRQAGGTLVLPEDGVELGNGSLQWWKAEALREALERYGSDRDAVARALGVCERTVRVWRKQLGW